MAKSTRSKVKRAFRAKKRTEGVYAATEAARLHRLHMKLKALTAQHEGDEEQEDAAEGEEGAQMDTDGAATTSAAAAADGQSSSAENANGTDGMDLDGAGPSDTTKRISTHGPRNSRREQWRLSKGLSARPKPKGMNRQGLVAARRKSGRSHRRR